MKKHKAKMLFMSQKAKGNLFFMIEIAFKRPIRHFLSIYKNFVRNTSSLPKKPLKNRLIIRFYF